LPVEEGSELTYNGPPFKRLMERTGMIDYRIPFFIGTGLSVVSLFFAHYIRLPKKSTYSRLL
jgi:hypothetical protein